MADKPFGIRRLLNAGAWFSTDGIELIALLSLLLCASFALCGCALTGSANSGQPESSTLSIVTQSLSAAQEQSSYEETLSASGGQTPYSWKVSSGSLPEGLSLTSATGEISGEPTVTGTFAFTIEVEDSSSPLQTATHSYSLQVAASGSFHITTTSVPSGTVGQAYAMTLAATGGATPYTWSVISGALPSGLSLDSGTGKISGTPSVKQTASFGVQATDAVQVTATARFDLTISTTTSSGGSGLTITTASLPAGQVSKAYSATLEATGGNPPYSWSLAANSGPLPAGLEIGASTGTISGTPAAASTYSFTMEVSDSSVPAKTGYKAYMMSTLGVPLDQYGARADIKCSTTTPYFHLEEISGHWYFCDALGNGFISMAVGNVSPDPDPTLDCKGVNTYPIYAAKYGTSWDVSGTGLNWGWQTLKRMQSWGFNTLGEDSGNGGTLPWATCTGCGWPGWTQPIPIPIIVELKPSINALANRFGYINSAVKDVISGTNQNYTSLRATLFDVFDPNLAKEWQSELADPTGLVAQQIRANSPYILGVLTDDADYFWGSGAGPDFKTGHTTANIAWTTLLTSPVRTYANSTQFSSQAFLYSPQQLYSKAQATNPATACSISNPCSLRDYLWQKYGGSISALNAAWGSNYTTFDSSGKQIVGETIGTGNGSTRSFTHTLAHPEVSPFTVLISVGGTAQIGDCPGFDTSSNCPAEAANSGTLGSPTADYIDAAGSTINYSTGEITLDFTKAPAEGAVITVNYIYGGWMAGGTGLMDEDGSHTAWVGTNPYCLEGADPNYPTYFACTGAGAEPAPNADANLGADLDNWESQFAAQYFKTMHDGLKAVSKVPYLGLDAVGGWGGPAYSKFLEGMGPYVDAGFFGSLAPLYTTSNAEFLARYQYATRYLGDIPFLNFGVISAEADSSYSCNPALGAPAANFATQAARGQAWYNWVSNLQTTPGYYGSFPVVGFDWWSWQDFQDWNQGLVSVHDNAYDGHEDVTGSVSCSSPLQAFHCGGEYANYGDVITQVKAGNLFWLTQ